LKENSLVGNRYSKVEMTSSETMPLISDRAASELANPTINEPGHDRTKRADANNYKSMGGLEMLRFAATPRASAPKMDDGMGGGSAAQ
jgi:hypothetical protein